MTTARRRWFQLIVAVSISIAAIVSWGYLSCGVPLAMFYRLRGESLYFPSYNCDLGEVTAGTATLAVFSATNIGDEDITVAGSRMDCGCVTPFNLPLLIKSGETRSIEFRVIPTITQEKAFRIRAALYLSPASGRHTLTIHVQRTVPQS